MIQLKLKLTKANIFKALSKKGVDEYTLFRYYCTNFSKINKKFKSEFRTRIDESSSSCITCMRGTLFFKDFGEGGKALNIIEYIKKKYNYPEKIGFIYALEKIRQDFSLNDIESLNAKDKVIKSDLTPIIYPKVELKNKIRTIIRYRSRDLNEKDINFWKQYNITTETLKLFRVIPIDYFWINDWCFQGEQYSYCYIIYDGIRKIYQPYSKYNKWYSNASNEDYYIQGLQYIINNDIQGDTLIITKSLKDIMALHEVGIVSVAANSESTKIPHKTIEMLKRRFKKLVLYYDNDEAGKKFSKEVSEELKIENLINPDDKPKDFSDWIKFNKDEAITFIKNLK